MRGLEGMPDEEIDKEEDRLVDVHVPLGGRSAKTAQSVLLHDLRCLHRRGTEIVLAEEVHLRADEDERDRLARKLAHHR